MYNLGKICSNLLADAGAFNPLERAPCLPKCFLSLWDKFVFLLCSALTDKMQFPANTLARRIKIEKWKAWQRWKFYLHPVHTWALNSIGWKPLDDKTVLKIVHITVHHSPSEQLTVFLSFRYCWVYEASNGDSHFRSDMVQHVTDDRIDIKNFVTFHPR